MKDEPFTPPRNTYLSYEWMRDRDELVLLPAVCFVLALFDRGEGWRMLAFGLWALGYPVWCAWTLWRVSDRFPHDDIWRSIAILVYGGTAWLTAAPLGLAIGGRPGFAVSFLTIFVSGIWALVVARKYRPPTLSKVGRARLLWGAVAVCGVWAAIFAVAISLVLRHPDKGNFMDGAAIFLGAPLGLLALVLAILLARSAIRGWTPPRPLTAESLLADPPPA